jgi:hypothetical protein
MRGGRVESLRSFETLKGRRLSLYYIYISVFRHMERVGVAWDEGFAEVLQLTGPDKARWTPSCHPGFVFRLVDKLAAGSVEESSKWLLSMCRYVCTGPKTNIHGH